MIPISRRQYIRQYISSPYIEGWIPAWLESSAARSASAGGDINEVSQGCCGGIVPHQLPRLHCHGRSWGHHLSGAIPRHWGRRVIPFLGGDFLKYYPYSATHPLVPMSHPSPLTRPLKILPLYFQPTVQRMN